MATQCDSPKKYLLMTFILYTINMQTIDPTTNEIIFTVGTDEVSLTELLGIDINLESDFPDLSFRIKNLDETNTLLVKSRFKNWK
ncbi:MAG: hypothetical protein LBU27_02920 [Candidatus Peribacteria bacterium]|nr:hypothetical protein [Candidatus Peribacteria bacterium]